MQSLLGSLDFCQCEDCRSVLSPAAYLVDVLHVIETDASGRSKPAYPALVERRPDIPNLPLTCENTNTVLPYIDIVNEIFEYYIANDAVDKAAAYSTGDVPPLLSSTPFWSPIPQLTEIGREEAFFRRADHWLPA